MSPPDAPAPSAGDPEAFERRIGERLLLYAGMIVLVLGVAFFLRYAFEHQWMSPGVRVLLGAAGGIGFLAAGRRLAGAGFRQYGLFLSGGGLAILFLSAYSAYAFFGIIGQIQAFTLLATIAAFAAVLADREASLPLAVMAVCGGFATPFLAGGSGDAQVVLFSYDAALVAVTMYLAHRRQWPWLNLASFAMTVITVAAWADEHYTDARYLRTEIFLTLFCAMFVAMLRENRRSTDLQARIVSAVLWAAPVLYHGASIAILYDHGTAFCIYLVALSVALAAGSLEASAPAVRCLGWAAVMVPLLVWLEDRRDVDWLPGAATAVTVWLAFLLAQVRLVRRADAFDGWDVTLLHASGIGVFVALYVALLDVQSARWMAAVAVVLAIVNSALWQWLRTAPIALNWLGVSFALCVVAVAVGLEGHWTVVMWASEAAVMIWLGLRLDNRWFRAAGLGLFAVAALRWLETEPPRAGEPFVAILNARALAGLFVIGALYLAAWMMRGPEAKSDAQKRAERVALLLAASTVTVLLLTVEITAFWAVGPGRGVDAALGRQLMLSAAWAGYAGLLIAVGMRYHYPPVRYFAIVLFGLTLIKVFAVDVQQLDGIHRVIGFLVVGGILLLVSFLYQRTRGVASN